MATHAIIYKSQERQKSNLGQNSAPAMPFVEHLKELKYRFLWWSASLLAASLAGYFLFNPLFNILVRPLGQPLYYSSPMGGLETVIEVSFLFGFVASSPVFIYQLIKFVEPAIGSISKKQILFYVLISYLLATAGILIAYYLLLPASFQFLAKFGTQQLNPLISTKDYLSLVSKYIVGFSFLFQMPLVVFILNRLNPLNTTRLLGYFKYVAVGSFIVSAILTPTPDIVNQTFIAAPVIVLYLVSILVIKLTSFYEHNKNI